MGGIISRIWRKQSTLDKLESIEKKMDGILSLKRRDTQREKQYMGSLLLYSVIGYLMMALFFYFYYEAKDWRGRATQILPLLLVPVLIFGIRRLLQWYFVKRIARNQMALEDLRAEKKQILEEVKDKESYKKAKEILDRFDPSSSPPTPAASTPVTSQPVAFSSKPGQPPVPKLRQRPMTARGIRTPNTPPQAAQHRGPPSLAPRLTPQQQLMMRPQAPPRPILPRERGTVDKLVDFLVGDGPSSRYALICRHCYSHNGMALQEEFEYLAYKCAYCGTFNPSKKVRPQAPQLPTAASPSPRSGTPSHVAERTPQPRQDSTSEGGSQSDSDAASSAPGPAPFTPQPNAPSTPQPNAPSTPQPNAPSTPQPNAERTEDTTQEREANTREESFSDTQRGGHSDTIPWEEDTGGAEELPGES